MILIFTFFRGIEFDFSESSMDSSNFAKKRVSLLRGKVISILTGVYEGHFSSTYFQIFRNNDLFL